MTINQAINELDEAVGDELLNIYFMGVNATVGNAPELELEILKAQRRLLDKLRPCVGLMRAEAQDQK